MVVHEGAEEILVSSGYNCAAFTRFFDSDWWRFFDSAVYLYTFLKNDYVTKTRS